MSEESAVVGLGAAVDRLPQGEYQYPVCGACGDELDHDGGFYCESCGLSYDDELHPSYTDDTAPPCGKPCTNEWHAIAATRQDTRIRCYPCALPKGHTSSCWTGCGAHPDLPAKACEWARTPTQDEAHSENRSR